MILIAFFFQISATTKDVFVEVTGESVPVCREVMNELIKQFLSIEAPPEEDEDEKLAGGDRPMQTIIRRNGGAKSDGPLIIEPVIVETMEGELIVKYPSKIDLQLDNVKVEIK